MTSSFRTLGSQDVARHNGNVLDISEGGMRFRTDHFIAVQKPLWIEMEIPHHEPLEAVLRPVWVRELPSLGQYEVGAAFSSLSPEAQKSIRRFFGAKLVTRF